MLTCPAYALVSYITLHTYSQHFISQSKITQTATSNCVSLTSEHPMLSNGYISQFFTDGHIILVKRNTTCQISPNGRRKRAERNRPPSIGVSNKPSTPHLGRHPAGSVAELWH